MWNGRRDVEEGKERMVLAKEIQGQNPEVENMWSVTNVSSLGIFERIAQWRKCRLMRR